MAPRTERSPSRVEMPIELQNLPDRLFTLRIHFGLGRAEAHKECFRKKGATWAHWEDGSAMVPLRAIVQIARCWNVNLNWLVLGEGEMLNDR